MMYLVVFYKLKEEENTIILPIINDTDIIISFKEYIKEKGTIEIISMISYTCYGCAYDCPGQKDHMEKGGCLFTEEN